jgi:hypothetical protein
VPRTVLIASPEHLPTFKEQQDFSDALTFSDADALRALDVITRQRPGVVALDKLFASTSRGTALINRIKADPSLTSCEIRIVSADQSIRGPARAATAGSTPSVAVAEPVAPPAPAAVGPLDYRGTRRAPRVRIVEGTEVAIDGNAAQLLDLSVIGAMVLSPTILRPNQRVRVSIAEGTRPIRFGAGVAWAAFELLKTGPRYRAGLEFFDAEATALQRFIDANKKQS